jgi:hypothetical protein
LEKNGMKNGRREDCRLDDSRARQREAFFRRPEGFARHDIVVAAMNTPIETIQSPAVGQEYIRSAKRSSKIAPAPILANVGQTFERKLRTGVRIGLRIGLDSALHSEYSFLDSSF